MCLFQVIIIIIPMCLFQVIIVVFENLEVWCLNHELKLLWQPSPNLPADVSNKRLKSVAALVTSHGNADAGQHGMIYVGGSFVDSTTTTSTDFDSTSLFYVFSLRGDTGHVEWKNFNTVSMQC